MIERLNNVEPQQALGIIIISPIIAIASMDWRFVIPFGLLTIVFALTSLYKIFTSWTWAKQFIAYAIAGVFGIAVFVVWGSIIILLIILAGILFVGMPDGK